MAPRCLAALLVISLAAGCGESFTEPVRDSAPLSLALVLVDDGSTNFRPVASNVPAFGNVWNLLAQSFTAEDRRISFGFRMKDASAALPNAGASLEYSLYAGENSYSSSTFLARRVVVLPSTLATDPRSVFGDLGFVDADFTDVELTPGEKYTVLVGRSGFSLPDLGTTTGFGVWTSLSNPYSGGRFFFPVGYAGWVGLFYNNDFFSQQDMQFRVTPASVSAPPLAIVPPPAITVATDVGRCDAQVNLGTPTTAGGTPPITLAATPAGPYLLGTTTVTWTATDASGTTASATQFVTVGDEELPRVVPPPNVSTVTDPGKPTASVSPGVATATDNCPGVTVTGARNDGQALNAPYPVGQTIITWTATDASANNANASQSVTVLSPQAQISNLETSVTNLALPRGTTTSLLTKLDHALAAANAGDVATACASLQDFINETGAQAGKKISISDANTLSAAAQRIRAVLGC